MWTCVHCRIGAPGVNLVMAQLSNLEKKVADIEKMVSAPKEVRQRINKRGNWWGGGAGEKKEQRKLNVIVRAPPESNKGTLEDRKKADCETVLAVLSDTLNLDMDIENVF